MKMQQYTEIFKEYGITSINNLLQHGHQIIPQISLPLGHKLKLLKRINELSLETIQVESIQGESIQGENIQSGKTEQECELEALPYSEESSDSESEYYGKNDPGALLRGEYNETDAQTHFMDARSQWITTNLNHPQVCTNS